jgi:hypothetical protein
MVTAFFTVSPSAGNVYETEFTITNLTQGNIYRYVWDFSEGDLIYDTKSPTFIYNTNGVKHISLTAVDVYGNVGTYTTTISTDYLYRDYLIFSEIPQTFADPGKPTETPFKIQVISSQLNQPLNVDLFAANSKSTPYEFVSKRWSFLNPTWRFLDKNKKIITTLPVTPTPIFSNNRVVAVSGEAEFYYIDSSSSGDTSVNTPVLITATLQTSGFSNFKDSSVFNYPSFSNNETVRAGLLWQTNDLIPDILKVTSNYFDGIPKQKWQTIKIPFIVTCHGNRSYRIPGAKDSISEVLFSYPLTNENGLLQDVKISLSGVQTTHYTVDDAPLYFQATDAQNFQTGGYIFTTVTCETTATNTAITAQTTAYNIFNTSSDQFIYPLGYAPNPFVWISNPGHKTLNKITVVPYTNNNTTIEYFIDNNLLYDGYIKEVLVPGLESNTTFNYTTSGFAGIFSIAIDPRNYDIISADAELDCLYKFSTEGTLLSTLQLSSISMLNSIQNAHTPSSVTLDKHYNIWVSLFNSVSVLKFDKDFNLLFSTAPRGVNLEEVYEGDFALKPPYVETDKDNNCWATYSSPLSCLLMKYSPSGSQIAQINLEKYSIPAGLAVDPQNNIWVSKSFNVTDARGQIDLYNGTTYQRISSIPDIYRPGSIALDRNNNLWFLFGDRRLGYFNTKTRTKTTWSVVTDDINDNPFTIEASFDREELERDSTLTGLGVDAYNRVWLLDSLNNNIWLLSASPQFEEQRIKKIKVTPNTPIGYYLDIKRSFVYTAPKKQQLLYANGDWTGNKWYQKYATYQAISAVSVSGVSNLFNIIPFINNSQVSRLNSTFDMAGYLKSLALPDNLNSNTLLFDDFLGAVVGNGLSGSYQDIGKTVYEKTANFTDYHGDIDTCGVDQLLSYATMTQTPFINYGAELPVDVKDFLNIASVSKEKIWGLPDEIPLLLQSINFETPLDTQTSIITAGTKLALRNKFDGKYTVVQVPLLSTTVVYPLSEFLGYGLEQPVTVKHDFYDFIPQYTGEYIETIIDWNNPQTTLSRHLSTFEDWFGNDGAVENSFNYILTKNIFG